MSAMLIRDVVNSGFLSHDMAAVSNEDNGIQEESMTFAADAFALPGDEGYVNNRAGEVGLGGEHTNRESDGGNNGYKKARGDMDESIDDFTSISGSESDEEEMQ